VQLAQQNSWLPRDNGVSADCKSAAPRGMVGSIPTATTNFSMGAFIMWQLFMILVSLGPYASSGGGPIVIDGFRTEQACLAHKDRIVNNTPQRVDLDSVFLADIQFKYVTAACIKVDK